MIFQVMITGTSLDEKFTNSQKKLFSHKMSKPKCWHVGCCMNENVPNNENVSVRGYFSPYVESKFKLIIWEIIDPVSLDF